MTSRERYEAWETWQAAERDMLERCVAVCESRITPGTGSHAILMGAANEIKELLNEQQRVDAILKAKVLPTDFGIPPKYSEYAENYANFKISEAAQPAPQVPMTDANIADLYYSITHQRVERLESPDSWVHKFARAVEARSKIGVKEVCAPCGGTGCVYSGEICKFCEGVKL